MSTFIATEAFTQLAAQSTNILLFGFVGIIVISMISKYPELLYLPIVIIEIVFGWSQSLYKLLTDNETTAKPKRQPTPQPARQAPARDPHCGYCLSKIKDDELSNCPKCGAPL